MWRWIKAFRQFRQDQRLLDMQARLDERERLINVLRAEIDSLSAVIARDRMRIESETAAYARAKATSEGTMPIEQPYLHRAG